MCRVEGFFFLHGVGILLFVFESVLHFNNDGRFCISACMQQQPAVGAIVHVPYISLFLFLPVL